MLPAPQYVPQHQLALPAAAPEPYYNGAQATIDQLRGENTRLRAQVKSLLAALSHSHE